MKLTEEQQSVVRSPSNGLRVVAFAGAGKTSTLRAYAEARPSKKLLYLAFNASTKAEAAGKFSSNVACLTTHGLAMKFVGGKYQHKLKTKIRPDQVSKILRLGPNGSNDLVHAKKALRALEHFLASSANSIEEFLGAEALLTEHTKDELRSASQLWDAMIDPTNTAMPMLHDGYLKLFQLSNPSLDYDCILFDEAQDANPVTLAILRRQRAAKVFVGDPHQQIYGFRRAENAMADPSLSDVLYLTQSFRFDDGIAAVANGVLSVKREGQQIVGGRKLKPSSSSAYLSRGNAAVFTRAVENAKAGRPFNIIGGVDGIQLDLLHDIWLLSEDRSAEVKDAFLRRFPDYKRLSNYAESLDERDLKAWLGVVDRHKNASEIPGEIALVRERVLKAPTPNCESVSTTHKAKGLEFGHVELASDFPSPLVISELDPAQREEGYPDSWHYGPSKFPSLWNGPRFKSAVVFPIEEINLRYVAVTRAEATISSQAWGETPFAKFAQFVAEHPEFVLAESDAVLKSAVQVKEVVSSPIRSSSTGMGSPFESLAWSERSPLAAVVAAAVTKFSDVSPHLAWRWFADEAIAARNRGTSAIATGSTLMVKSGLPRTNPILRDFLTECGLLSKRSVASSANAAPKRLARWTELRPGTTVFHSKFGKGTVLDRPSGEINAVEVMFEFVGVKLLALAFARLEVEV